jgi:signal transduction histidine kinase
MTGHPTRIFRFSFGMWPAATLLIVAVLAPTACVLWFMNAAVENERLAVRQRLQEVYGQELTDCQNRLAEHWKEVAAALEASHGRTPPEAFAELVDSGIVESALVYRDGRLAYPRMEMTAEQQQASPAEEHARSLEAAGQFDEAAGAYAAIIQENDDVNVRARARLGQARAMLHSENRSEAIELLIETLQEPEEEHAIDAAGRLIAPNALLLAIESLSPDDPTRPERVRRLADRLRHYDGPEMSSPQRLYLMQRLEQLAGEQFPTMRAEKLAIEIAPAFPRQMPNRSENHAAINRAGFMPDGWIMADSSGDTIGIWTAAGLKSSLAKSIERNSPAGASVALREPTGKSSEPAPFLSVPAGSYLPNWTIDLSLEGDDPFAAAAERHKAAYLWMACLAIGTIVVLAFGLAMYLRRQMALTRLKNDLISTVSHELKTPLSSMRVLTDTLLDSRLPSEKDQRDYLQLIARENLRLSRLIDNFLTFSRMERNKAAFDFRPLRVQVLFDAALEAMGERAGIVKSSAPPQLMVIGDADALVTLLVNLLDNAWKYSGEKKEIDLSAEQVSTGTVEIRVRDNGIGIARRHQRRIFQRFYQVDRQLSRSSGGCGLGLAIVQFIAKAHHADVSVVSQPGRGSTFCVRLPAYADRVARCESTNGVAAIPQDASATPFVASGRGTQNNT